jgi:hypothetical protein
MTGVNVTGDKLFSGVNDTGEKFIAVSLTPVNNLYFPFVIDTVQKKTKKPKIYRRCQRHRRKIVHRCQDTADKFFSGVSDTGD